MGSGRAAADPRPAVDVRMFEVEPHGQPWSDRAVQHWSGPGYQAALFDDAPAPRLVVRRACGWEGIGWDELNAVKAACGFGDRWAVEMFPPTEAVVNMAPLRHLFLMPGRPPCAWPSPVEQFASLAPVVARLSESFETLHATEVEMAIGLGGASN